MSDPALLELWLTIPHDCAVAGDFLIGDDAPDTHFILGTLADDTHLQFEGAALERFVELATRMLAIPVGPDSRLGPRVTLTADYKVA